MYVSHIRHDQVGEGQAVKYSNIYQKLVWSRDAFWEDSFYISSRRFQNTRGKAPSAALWRACNLTSFSPCLTGPVDYLFASRHKGPRFNLCGTGILLLLLSRYSIFFISYGDTSLCGLIFFFPGRC
jgi:hypothetical protein